MFTPREPLVPPEIAREISDHALFFRIGGIAAILTGIAAIVLPHVATLATGFAIGVLFLANGVIGAVTAFRGRSGGRILVAFLLGVLGVAAGLVLLLEPFAGILALTLFLAAYLVATGILRGLLAWRLRPHDGWGLVAFGGALAVALGVLIATGLPGNAFWVLGLIVGIDLIFFGAALLATVRAVRAENDEATSQGSEVSGRPAFSGS